MAYQTNDGLLFYNFAEGQNHANGLPYKDEGDKASDNGYWDTAIGYYDMAIPLLSSQGLAKAQAYYNRGQCHLKRSEYDQAIDDYTSAIGVCGKYYETKYISSKKELIAKSYHARGIAYNRKGNKEKAIADWKEAADRLPNEEDVKIALKNLADNGVQYKPKSEKHSSSSNISSSSKNENPVVQFFQKIGFENIDYFGFEINIPVSILLSLVISACITFLAYLFIPQKAVIVGIVSLVLSFFAFACTHKVLRVILIIIAAIGLALGVYSFVSPSKSKPATATTQTATATVNANVNFRTEPTTGDNIIRQLQQGEIVTLTGEISGGWTQIKHGNDTGWVSTEFLDK